MRLPFSNGLPTHHSAILHIIDVKTYLSILRVHGSLFILSEMLITFGSWRKKPKNFENNIFESYFEFDAAT